METSKSKRIAITSVRVFDGHTLSEPRTMVFDGHLISSETTAEHSVDGHGGVLLPGLIDAHVHIDGIQHLRELCKHGVTTALDMSTFAPDRLASLRHQKGLTDIRTAGLPASAPGSLHSRLMPDFPKESLLIGPEEAAQFVENRIAERSDYIKIISDIPGPSQATMDALVKEARKHNKLTVAHAAISAPYEMAQEAGVDFVTHVPMDKALDAAAAEHMFQDKRVAVPTLTMMESIPKVMKIPGLSYPPARESVTALHKAGVIILAGTDANELAGGPSPIAHGSSLHHELELLVEAGLSNLEALRAATILPAEHFGLNDRGAIKSGLRADLVLLAEDPIKDIRATRSIRRVWCAGVEVEI